MKVMSGMCYVSGNSCTILVRTALFLVYNLHIMYLYNVPYVEFLLQYLVLLVGSFDL